jgi:hypothetical protein
VVGGTRLASLVRWWVKATRDKSCEELGGGPWLTVPELLFEKKGLIPAIKQLLISYLRIQDDRIADSKRC